MQSKDKTAAYKSYTGQILNDFSSHNNFADINVQLPQQPSTCRPNTNKIIDNFEQENGEYITNELNHYKHEFGSHQ